MNHEHPPPNFSNTNATRLGVRTTPDSEDGIDITTIFRSCASSLNHADPLLCTPSFSLLDSMAALELMDPSMDCCEVPPPVTTEDDGPSSDDHVHFTVLRKTPTGLSDIPWEGLTMRDAREIGLESLIRLEAMLGGASVAESTYTCLYAHDAVLTEMRARLSGYLEKLKNDDATQFEKPVPQKDDPTSMAQFAVYALTRALVKLSEIARTIVQHADIYEEEDFVVNVYGFSFFDDGEDVADVLKLAMGRLDLMDDPDSALVARILRYELHFLEACTLLAKMTTKTVRSIAVDVKKLSTLGKGHLEHVLQATSPVSGTKPPSTTSPNPTIAQSFDSLVNRYLMGNSPVRKIRFNTLQISITNLITIVSEIDWALCDLLLNGSTFARIKRALSRVSTSSCNILTRSLIVLNLYFDDLLLGQHNLGRLVSQSMRSTCGAPRALTECDHGVNFLNRLAKPLYDTLKVLVLNRNRQRGYIDALMMNQWAGLQKEASGIDFYFREQHKLSAQTTPPFMTNYVLSTTIWILEHYLGLGVELRLFHGHFDYAVAFWYWDFLLSTQVNVIRVMTNAKLERRVMEERILMEEAQERIATGQITEHNRKKGKGGKKGVNNGSHKQVKVSEEDSEDSVELTHLRLRRLICRGIIRFTAAIYQAKILNPNAYQFTSSKQRFDKQFEAFTCIQQPPCLTFDDFVKGSDFSNVPPENLLASATDCFKIAKGVIDKMLANVNNLQPENLPVRKDELMNLAKVCVGNSLFLHQLTQRVRTGSKAKCQVTFDFGAHEQFCMIKIV